MRRDKILETFVNIVHLNVKMSLLDKVLARVFLNYYK